MKKTSLFLVWSLAASLMGYSQIPLKKIQPAFWYAGMQNEELQILLYGNNLSSWNVRMSDTAVRISRVIRTENPNYLFVYLHTKNLKPGTYPLIFTSGKKTFRHPFEIKARTRAPETVQGFTEEDILYLLMPDRFANGDTTNDVVAGLLEDTINRKNPGGRHGGDLQGIINHLDYIKELGMTTLWINPVLINDQPEYSYHGYAATDLYEVDPRYGNNEKYAELVQKAHEKGLKVIKDVIYNHVGNRNFIVRDPVSETWVNRWDTFTRCNYRPSTLLDPYASAFDSKRNSNGWFDHHMPDLNQQDPLLADYLIQNTIWWIEYAGLDGLRIDTYPYPDYEFMNRLVKAVSTEYPHISMVGEVWDQTVPNVAWFQRGSPINDETSRLVNVFDFNLYFALRDGLKEGFGWTTGLRRIYYTLAQDLLYADPFKNVTFLDNHDLSRIYSEYGQDYNKWRQAMTLLMTLRGIPCIYYGTELLFTGYTNPDGLVRQDFPGGWPGDSVNKFTATGRTEQENAAFSFVQKLAAFRSAYPVVQTGNLMQFVPDDDVYVYFRYDDKNCVMVAVNTSGELKKLDHRRYSERLDGYRDAIEVITGGMYSDLTQLFVEPHGVMIWVLRKN